MDTSVLTAIASTLGWTLLHFLWQGILIGVAYALARVWLRSDLARHHAALVGLSAVLLAPVLTFHSLWIQASGSATATALPAMSALATEMLGSSVVEAVANAGFDWTVWLSALWLVGALLISCHLLRDWLQLRRVIRSSLPPPANLVAFLEREVERFGLRRRVRLRLTASYSTPGVYGILRPVILMPVALLLKLPADQVQALIVHELAHVRRLDALGNLLAITARTLLYFHPVVHWLSHDLERLRERLCDDLVLERRVDRMNYARALSSVALTQNIAPAALLTASGGELTSRVHHILGLEEPASPQRNRQAPLLFALSAITVSLLGLNTLSGSVDATASRPELRVISGMLAPSLLSDPEALTAISAPDFSPPVLTPHAQMDQTTSDVVGFGSERDASPTTLELTPELPAADRVVEPVSSANVAPHQPLDIVEPFAASAPALDSAAALDPGMTSTIPANDLAASVDAPVQVTASTPVYAPMPEATRIVRPRYPSAARHSALEGTITLSFSVGSNGRVAAIEVIGSDPDLVLLEATAISALEQWRFKPASSPDQRYQQQFAFNLENGDEPVSSQERGCMTSTGSRICRRSFGP